MNKELEKLFNDLLEKELQTPNDQFLTERKNEWKHLAKCFRVELHQLIRENKKLKAKLTFV